METRIKTRFDIGQEIYLLTLDRDDVVPVKVHMVRAEWHPYGFGIYYDVYPTENGKYIKKGDYIKDMNDNWLFDTREEAEDGLKMQTL
jgi:hypothetical protein